MTTYACSFSAAEALAAAFRLLVLHGPLLFFALALAARLVSGNLNRLAAALVIYLSAAALIPWLLPRLSFGWLLAASLGLGVAGFFLRGDFLRGRLTLSPALAGWLTFGLVSLVLWVSKTRLPYVDHDPLTYQLMFAASWLREGRIFIVPTPFGDPSQAYGPAAASLYYVWLMAPVGSDLLAVTGAFPFYLLTVLSAAGLARELGARPDRLWAAAIFATGVVAYQGTTALTDVAVAGCFTAALAFGLAAAREKSTGAAALAALSAGLMLGVKVSGLSLLPLLLPVLAWAGWKGGRGLSKGWAAGAAAGAAAGLPFYLRNLVLTGNPVFPIRLGPLPGLYGRPEMLGWVFHYTGWAKWWEQVSGNFAPQLMVLAAAAAGLWLWDRRARGAEPGAFRPETPVVVYLLLLPLLLDRLIWWVLPYQELRFWAPIMPVLMAVLTTGLSRRGWLLGLGFIVTSYSFDALTNLVNHPAESPWPALVTLGAPMVTAAVFFGLWTGLKRISGRTLPAWSVPAAALVLAAAATVALLPGHPLRRMAILRYYENFGGWSALPCDRRTTVAYTGANVPYPLFGPRLENRVVYVSPAGDVAPRDHELWRSRPEKPRFLTAEPALSRLRLCPRGWLEGLRRAGAEWLLVMKVPKNELYNVEHGREGWPTEKRWAEAAPEIFKLVYDDSFSRLYSVATGGGDIARLPGNCEDRPADAPTACGHSQELCRDYFPLYFQAINRASE